MTTRDVAIITGGGRGIGLATARALLARNLDVALGLAQTAKSQLANDPQVANTLGWVYYKKGLPGLAVPILRDSSGACDIGRDVALSCGFWA